MSSKRVLEECQARVPYQSVAKKCQARVSYKSAASVCQVRVSHNWVRCKMWQISICLCYSTYVSAFGFVGFILFFFLCWYSLDIHRKMHSHITAKFLLQQIHVKQLCIPRNHGSKEKNKEKAKVGKMLWLPEQTVSIWIWMSRFDRNCVHPCRGNGCSDL